MKQYFRSVEGKLFLLVGALLSGVGFLAIGIHSERRIEARQSARIEKYEHTLSLLSASILQFERDAEAKMWLALQHLKLDDLKGLPSRDLLVQKSKKLGMSHFFVIDSTGRFIRSTNEAPELIPNLYVFSDEYRSLLSGPEIPLATPLIPPDPEIRPYKFLTIFHQATGRFLHAGLRADFMEIALSKLVSSDPEILEVHILSPNGTSLGRFDRGIFRFETERVKLPELIQSSDSVSHSKEGTRLLHWVDSSHPDCGQCKKSGDLRSGRHQYLFSLLIKDESLNTWTRRETLKAFGFSILWCMFAMGVAFGLANRFTLRIRLLNRMIEQSHRESGPLSRIELEGADEVAELARQFQALLERIDAHQHQALLVARAKIELDVARQVAHDLRSPLTTLEVLVNRTETPAGSEKEMVQHALRRIQQVAEALLWQREPSAVWSESHLSGHITDPEPLYPHLLIEKILSEKQVEHSRFGVRFEYKPSTESRLFLVSGEQSQLERVLSNLLNNAVESYQNAHDPVVLVELGLEDESTLYISIRDQGRGMGMDLVSRLGQPGFTHGKAKGSGLGIHHAKAMMNQIGGELVINSSPGLGTNVTLRLPRIDSDLPVRPDFMNANWDRIVMVDDDPLIHQAWNLQLNQTIPTLAFLSLEAFKHHYRRNFDSFERTLVLMDHEFRGEPEFDGCSTLLELGLEGQAVLVTGRFTDGTLLKQALLAGIRVVPKILVSTALQKTG